MSQFLTAYEQAGPEAFSKLACQIAPYFSTINPLFKSLKVGYSEVSIPFDKSITNHIGTVHAIAMCNAAELVAGTAIDVSLPTGWRWIPKAMSVEYLAKAKTDLKAISDVTDVDLTTTGDKVIPVDIYDTEGVKVFRADITMYVTENN